MASADNAIVDSSLEVALDIAVIENGLRKVAVSLSTMVEVENYADLLYTGLITELYNYAQRFYIPLTSEVSWDDATLFETAIQNVWQDQMTGEETHTNNDGVND